MHYCRDGVSREDMPTLRIHPAENQSNELVHDVGEGKKLLHIGNNRDCRSTESHGVDEIT